MKLAEVKYSTAERCFLVGMILTVLTASTWIIVTTVDFLRKTFHG